MVQIVVAKKCPCRVLVEKFCETNNQWINFLERKPYHYLGREEANMHCFDRFEFICEMLSGVLISTDMKWWVTNEVFRSFDKLLCVFNHVPAQRQEYIVDGVQEWRAQLLKSLI